jgi:hypothetical protein
MSRGFDVEFCDLEGRARFDFLATKDGAEVEIECKAMTADIGRSIHRKREYQLASLLQNDFSRELEKQGGRLLTVSLPGALSGAQLPEIAASIGRVLDTGVAFSSDTCSIEFLPFDVGASPFARFSAHSIPEDTVRAFTDELSGRAIRHLLSAFSPRQAAIIVGLRSNREDKVLMGIYQQLKAAARQLTGLRSGLICAHLADITTAEMHEIAGQPNLTGEPSGLQAMMGKFFDSDQRNHVHSVAYLSSGDVIREQFLTGDPLYRRIRTGLSEKRACFGIAGGAARCAAGPASGSPGHARRLRERPLTAGGPPLIGARGGVFASDLPTIFWPDAASVPDRSLYRTVSRSRSHPP